MNVDTAPPRIGSRNQRQLALPIKDAIVGDKPIDLVSRDVGLVQYLLVGSSTSCGAHQLLRCVLCQSYKYVKLREA